MDEKIFFCGNCKKFFNLTSRLPLINEQGTTWCFACASTVSIKWNEVRDAFLLKLRQELIYPDCHRSLCHPDGNHPHGCYPDIQAHSINIKTLQVFCEACFNPNSNIILIESQGARFPLLNLLKKAVEDKNSPREYLQECTDILYRESISANEILTCLRNKLRFDSEFILCRAHLRQAAFIDRANFVFKCTQCKNNECDDLYADYNYYNKAVEARQHLNEVKTSAFRSVVLKLVKNGIKTPKDYKDIILEFSHMWSEKDSNLAPSSRCLLCEELFNLGDKLPVMLHEEEKHEICLKCYSKSTDKVCPIDRQPFPSELKPLLANYLFKVQSRACTRPHDDGKERYSYIFGIFPYRFPCGHGICKECSTSNDQTGGFTCYSCSAFFKKTHLMLNHHLLNQLKFLETCCENSEHIGQVARYFNHVDIITYCNKCKINPRYRTEVNPDKFYTALIKKIRENDQTQNHKIISMILSKYYLYPLLFLLKAYRYLANPDARHAIHMRFNKILPLNSNTYSYWIADDKAKESFIISSNAFIELAGLIIGKTYSTPGSLKIFYNNSLICEEVIPQFDDYNSKDHKVLFREPIISDSKIDLQIIFSFGCYCHGLPMKKDNKINLNPTINLPPDAYLSISTSSTMNGNIIIGGPILGLVLGNCYAYKDN